MSMISYKKVLLYIAALAAMVAVLRGADFQEILVCLLAMEIRHFIVATLMQLLTITLIIWQWRLASLATGKSIPWGKLIYLNMAGTFVESVTPAMKAGAELTRIYLLKSHVGLELTTATSIVILQKTISLLTFILLNIAGLIFFLFLYSGYFANKAFFVANLVVFAVVFLLLVIFIIKPKSVNSFIRPIPVIPARIKLKAESLLISLQETFANLMRNTKLCLFMLIQAFAIWLLYVVKAYIIVQSLAIESSIMEVAVATLFSYMIAMIPLFPGGLGSFEAAYTFMFVSMGYDIEQGIAAALALRLVTFWFVFLISVLYMIFHAMTKNVRKMLSWLAKSNFHGSKS